MSQFEEYWTVTRRGLVVAGCPSCIRELAQRLDLPPDAPVEVSTSRATLALWGDALRRYFEAGFGSGDVPADGGQRLIA